jgi:hypothetical protein
MNMAPPPSAMATPPPPYSALCVLVPSAFTARAETRRKGRLSALHTHTKSAIERRFTIKKCAGLKRLGQARTVVGQPRERVRWVAEHRRARAAEGMHRLAVDEQPDSDLAAEIHRVGPNFGPTSGLSWHRDSQPKYCARRSNLDQPCELLVRPGPGQARSPAHRRRRPAPRTRSGPRPPAGASHGVGPNHKAPIGILSQNAGQVAQFGPALWNSPCGAHSLPPVPPPPTASHRPRSLAPPA